MTKVARVSRGTRTAGRSERRHPGRRTPGSGTAASASMPTRKAASSSHQTRCVGAGPYWASALTAIAPRPRPSDGDALVSTPARPVPGGCNSSSAAPIAPVARPTLTPCSALARYSAPTPAASNHTTHATALMASPAMMTGRLPTWSDSRPSTSSVTSRVRAYTAKTAVAVAVEKWNRAW
ncbi:MAG TPA: hypothetical protein VFW65_24945 [Pseudonocardiaceae bacterium]|nr:hypothetical protein [Pseudonocardiaceae bacterium]